MALNPAIIGQIRAPEIDDYNTAQTKRMNLANLGQTNQMNEMKLAQTQTQMDQEQQTSQLAQQGRAWLASPKGKAARDLAQQTGDVKPLVFGLAEETGQLPEKILEIIAKGEEDRKAKESGFTAVPDSSSLYRNSDLSGRANPPAATPPTSGASLSNLGAQPQPATMPGVSLDSPSLSLSSLGTAQPAMGSQQVAPSVGMAAPSAPDAEPQGIMPVVQGKPKTQNMSNLARLIAERAVLPEGSPQASTYDNAIRKESETSRQITPRIYVGGGGSLGIAHGIAGLTTEQNNALFGPQGAVTTGKLDPDRINSKTARIMADAYITNPNVDMNKLASDARLMRNAGFMNKAITLETLPEVMSNMVEAGKKVGFNDLRIVGKMQAWAKGETNDPDLTSYMVQRNDALLSIASAMRGVGMSDKAHQAEIEASSPTMSPAALDAWLKAQTISLKPRLERIHKYTRQDEGASGMPANTITHPKFPGFSISK